MAIRQRKPGSTLGSYTILRGLAAGGMGAVYVARDAAGREVALKLIHQGSGRRRHQRFEVEAQAVARLRHSGIVTVHDYGRDERGEEFLVMTLVRGATLLEQVEQGGPLAPRAVAQLGRELADALAYAHEQGVLHRDLKPDNVLINEDGRAVLTDFGLAKVVDQSQHLTQTGELLGTPAYMPPEQIQGKREAIGPPADVYGLGATLYAALTGHPPHEADSPYQLLAMAISEDPAAPGADPTLDRIVMQCLRKEPADRYPNAGALRDDLDRYLRGESVEARVVARRRPWLPLAAGGLALAAIPLVALTHTPSRPAPPVATPEPPATHWIDQQVAGIAANEVRPVLEALQTRSGLTQPEAERLRAVTAGSLPALCERRQPPIREILLRLELLEALQARFPQSAEHEGADAVVLLATRLEDAAAEQLGNTQVIDLLTAVGATGYRPSELSQMKLFQAMRLSKRPMHAEFLERSHRYLLALIRFGAYISNSNFAAAVRLRGAWTPGPPRTPEEHYLALRLTMVNPLIDSEVKQEQIRRFLSSDPLQQLDPRNQAFVLQRHAGFLPPLERPDVLRRAVELAPTLRTVRFDLAYCLLHLIKDDLQAGRTPEALARFSEACEHADASLRHGAYASYGNEEDALEVAVELHALAGEQERAHEIIETVQADAIRAKLDLRRQRGMLFRESFGLEAAEKDQAR